MGTQRKSEILAYATERVAEYALEPEVAQAVDLHSQTRGGAGPRGYGLNRQGLEIAWWVHPERVRQELELVLDHLALDGSERLVTLGCGPAFHEAALAKFFPKLQITATDFDPKEIETAQTIAKQLGVTNVQHLAMAAEGVGSLKDQGPFDAAVSIAVLHDVPDPDAMCRGLSEVLRPGGKFVFTYNPPRQRAQFPNSPPLREVIAKYFTIELEGPLVTAEHSKRYFGAIAERSELERGYPLRWDAVVARLGT